MNEKAAAHGEKDDPKRREAEPACGKDDPPGKIEAAIREKAVPINEKGGRTSR
jgi:hypothetical protein